MFVDLGPLDVAQPYAEDDIIAAIARLTRLLPSEVQVRSPAVHLTDCGGSGPDMRLWHQDCAGHAMDLIVWANVAPTMLRFRMLNASPILESGHVYRFCNMCFQHRQPDLPLPERARRWFARAVVESNAVEHDPAHNGLLT